MPADPAELLALASKMNGLQNAGTEPLHVKATYQLLDDKGDVKETGTFEEFWVSDKKYKKFTQAHLSARSTTPPQMDYFGREISTGQTSRERWLKTVCFLGFHRSRRWLRAR